MNSYRLYLADDPTGLGRSQIAKDVPEGLHQELGLRVLLFSLRLQSRSMVCAVALQEDILPETTAYPFLAACLCQGCWHLVGVSVWTGHVPRLVVESQLVHVHSIGIALEPEARTSGTVRWSLLLGLVALRVYGIAHRVTAKTLSPR